MSLMKGSSTPGKAARLGMYLMFLGAGLMKWGEFPYYGIGLLLGSLGAVSITVGVLVWLRLYTIEELGRDFRQALKDLWYGDR